MSGAPPFHLSDFTAAFSRERLARYRAPGDTDAMVLARYSWNHAISDAMNLPHHVLEITLRNAIDRAGRSVAGTPAAHGGVPSWLDASPPLLAPKHAASTESAREDLNDRGVPRTPGRLVAEMPLGVWVLLFGSYYDQGRGATGRPDFGFGRRAIYVRRFQILGPRDAIEKSSERFSIPFDYIETGLPTTSQSFISTRWSGLRRLQKQSGG